MSSKQQLSGKKNENVLFGSPSGLTFGESIGLTNQKVGNQSGGRRRRRRMRGRGNDIIYNDKMVIQPHLPVMF